ncbi:F0F1 ATP synthase subunit gamma [Photobacterium ganghwense]|uniref:F0F1 ATP synthase subunit gamma n=1 Tax=Photobacterium ganghwense TaxID=320778 RepID=UPI000AF7600A|nr:F0F1 ATP synthase subunit gamma [Photobacterium ganghwense]
MIQGRKQAIVASVQEYIFVSLFRACAESLASENACRLIAMQRAEKNIENQLETLGTDFHRLRQRVIDEELFDVIAGFESYGTATHRP